MLWFPSYDEWDRVLFHLLGFIYYNPIPPFPHIDVCKIYAAANNDKIKHCKEIKNRDGSYKAPTQETKPRMCH